MARAEVTVTLTDLPRVQALFSASHRLLTLRLFGNLDTAEGLVAWNALIEAHDAIADAVSSLNGGSSRSSGGQS